jgi:hypothetical protein
MTEECNYEFIRKKEGGREERGIMNDELKVYR